MLKFSEFPVRIIDVSQFNDNAETDYKPTFEKLIAEGFRGVGIRVGYGIVEDRMFRWYWEKAKGKMDRAPYFYFDFYSHKGTGMRIEDWAIEQAAFCANLLRADPGEMKLKIDCEPSIFDKITLVNASEYARGVKAFIMEYFRLTGVWIEIYCSPGLLWVFGDWFKDLDLWLAWYNRLITWKDILNKVASYKWRGQVRIWQYASDGDINNDGIADGLQLGLESKFLDLNVFLGTEEDYSVYCGGTQVVEHPASEDPEDETQAIPAGNTREIAVKKVASVVNMRAAPMAGPSVPIFKALPVGTTVECLERIQRPGEIWWRIGQGQYCAELYNGMTFLK
ncbi:MAG: hypothetical protein GYA45_11640 [Pelolinea sp.]|nr:hypothetical protein [Pelolinea sp.]